MKREKLKDLIEWKGKKDRKPLILKGARQVGKTWLLKEFGRTQYEKMVYINFEKSGRLKSLFTDDFDIDRLIIALQVESGISINPNDTLLVFDEIQAIPEALTSLKYFREDAPEFHVIAAGSLLGIALHSNVSFPVGKVDFMTLYPMTFEEFMKAAGEEGLFNILQTRDWKLISAYKAKFIDLLKHYYYVGGMPEVVSKYCDSKNFTEVRTVQKQILSAYDQDFSKHAPYEIVPRIRMIWNSIPAQLAKENKKFIYGQLKKGARAKDYELALSWLTDCGQVQKVFRVNKPGIPLIAYQDPSAFKLYLVDVGLLAAKGDIDARTLLSGNTIFTEFKGALTEQYVLQQLLNSEIFTINYWSAERSTAEVDFVVQHQGEVIPIEVKAEENLQAKSLKVYHEKFNPKTSVRISMSDYRKQEWMTNLPLYAISQLKSLI